MDAPACRDGVRVWIVMHDNEDMMKIAQDVEQLV